MKLLTEEQMQEVNNKMEKSGNPRRILGIEYVNGEPFYLLNDIRNGSIITLDEPVEFIDKTAQNTPLAN